MPKLEHDEGDKWVTTADAAAILEVHVRTVHRLTESGELNPAIKIPGKTGAYMYHRADVEALAQSRRADVDALAAPSRAEAS